MPNYMIFRHLRHRHRKKHGGDVCSSGLFCSVGWFVSHALRQSTGHILILMEPICCPKMSVTNQFTLCNNQEEKRSQLLHGKNQKYCMVLLVYRQWNIPSTKQCGFSDGSSEALNIQSACYISDTHRASALL